MLLNNDFSIKYQSTNSIVQANDLSRLVNAHKNLPEDSIVAAVLVESDIVLVLTDTVSALSPCR